MNVEDRWYYMIVDGRTEDGVYRVRGGKKLERSINVFLKEG